MAQEAVTQTELLVVKRRAVQHLAMRDTWIGRQLRRRLACDLEQAREHIVLLGRMTATERVRDFLAQMNRRLRSAEMDRLPMSRLDMADYLGVTIETVSRTISQLKAEGMVVRPGPIISRRWDGTFRTAGVHGPAV
jgi:CRP/FNR family transcriptional regulator, nitrogen fixation regulation protein